MGFLDHLMGDARDALAGHETTLAPMLLSALGGGDGQAAQTNGIAGLVSRFQQAGMGDVVQSWISNQHPNQPVTSDQVNQALGQDQVAALAQKMGLPQSAVLGTLAAMLPKLVNALTPNGQVPTTPRDIRAAAPDQAPGEAEAPARTADTGASDDTDPTESVQT